MSLLNDVLKHYLSTHKELIATEQVDENNAIVSLPLHFVGNHRVEVSITKATDGLFLLSDLGRTIGELKEYGYAVSQNLLSRMVKIAKPANVRIVNENLVMDCRPDEVGTALHIFAEAAKTIGDAYLAFQVKTPSEKKLIEEVRNLLGERHILYKFAHKVHGKLDVHPIDFYVPPNGHPGLALEVLAGYNTHSTAQIWYFKCQDIRAFDSRLKVGIVYDVEDSNWSKRSEAILHNVADFALPSNDLPSLPDIVKSTVS
jgi:hypothetical protein